jgi:succinate dehydrogenase / fumarate reductase, cytochrome b subunit
MMQRVATLYRSSVGKKILMAFTGIVLFGFIVLHMVGNLKVLLGPEELNDYGRFLRTVGYPAVPNKTALWAVRLVLLFAVIVHMVAAFQTWAQSRNARAVGYRKLDDLSFSYASRTMRWGGVIILLFVVYHLLHFTTGTLHPSFVEGDVYHNFVAGFQNPLVLFVYLVAQAALCLHLYHGLWSVTQTLGANHPKYNPIRRPAAIGLALLIFLGFVIPPVLVLLGVVA